MLEEIIRNILVYVVMVTVLKGLVSNEKFLEIFRFVSGMILIMLCISPVVSVFSGSDRWYQGLEENILEGDREQLEQEAKLARGRFEEILLQECEEEMAQQLRRLAKGEGEQPGTVKVTMKKNKAGELALETVSMGILRQEEKGDAQEKPVVPVGKIVVDAGAEEGEQAEEGRQDGAEDRQGARQDARTRKIKRKICNEYELSGKAVIVWRENGKDG